MMSSRSILALVGCTGRQALDKVDDDSSPVSRGNGILKEYNSKQQAAATDKGNGDNLSTPKKNDGKVAHTVGSFKSSPTSVQDHPSVTSVAKKRSFAPRCLGVTNACGASGQNFSSIPFTLSESPSMATLALEEEVPSRDPDDIKEEAIENEEEEKGQKDRSLITSSNSSDILHSPPRLLHQQEPPEEFLPVAHDTETVNVAVGGESVLTINEASVNASKNPSSHSTTPEKIVKENKCPVTHLTKAFEQFISEMPEFRPISTTALNALREQVLEEECKQVRIEAELQMQLNEIKKSQIEMEQKLFEELKHAIQLKADTETMLRSQLENLQSDPEAMKKELALYESFCSSVLAHEAPQSMSEDEMSRSYHTYTKRYRNSELFQEVQASNSLTSQGEPVSSLSLSSSITKGGENRDTHSQVKCSEDAVAISASKNPFVTPESSPDRKTADRKESKEENQLVGETDDLSVKESVARIKSDTNRNVQPKIKKTKKQNSCNSPSTNRSNVSLISACDEISKLKGKVQKQKSVSDLGERKKKDTKAVEREKAKLIMTEGILDQLERDIMSIGKNTR